MRYTDWRQAASASKRRTAISAQTFEAIHQGVRIRYNVTVDQDGTMRAVYAYCQTLPVHGITIHASDVDRIHAWEPH